MFKAEYIVIYESI